MKLHDLDSLKKHEKATRILETRLGKAISFSKFSKVESEIMLDRVRDLINEHRQTPNFYNSEKSSAYLKLLMLEEGLSARLSEQDNIVMMPVDTKDPKVQQTLKKAQSGQTLNPDETKLVTAIATQKKESSKKPVRRMVKESELQQAQVVLAAQDMIDRVQKMMEDVSEMQFKDLPALSDSIKNDMGTDQATQFQSAVAPVLTQLLSAIQTSKTQLESAQGVLTGQAPVVPGEMPGAEEMPAGDDLGLDDLADKTLPDEEPVSDEDDEDLESSLGRERR